MENLKTVEVVSTLLNKYQKDDHKLVHDTIDMLCGKGIANGCYQDFQVLIDILSILEAFEKDIKQKGN